MGLTIDPKHVKRYGRLAALLARHGRSDIVRQAGLEGVLDAGYPEDGEPVASDAGEEERAEALASDLEAMGPTYVKLGQLLSTRVDLLPAPYLKALARLQDRVEPFGFEEVERIVSEELGVRLSKAFDEFEPEPVASASLAQVHRARLRNGRVVAVKVQRPGIRPTVRDDLDALGELAAFLDRHSDRARRYRLVDILEQFRRSLMRELDFRNEARNLETLAENLAGMDGIVVPRPVPDYSSSRVLTMDLIRGAKVTALSPVALVELDRERLADDLFRAYLRQILVDGFFHADPHPGNVFVTDDDRLALLDLGQVATLGPGARESLMKLLLAVAEAHAEDAARILLELSEVDDDADTAGFGEAVGDLVMQAEGRTAGDIALGAVVLQLVRVAGEHGISPPAELAMLGKTLVNLDQVGRTLDPELEPNAAIRRHAAELMERRMLESLTPSAMFKTLMEANELVQRMPQRMNRIMELLAANQLTLGINAIDEVRFIAGLEKIANRITLGLVIAALIVGAAMLVGVEGGPQIMGYPALALILFVAAVIAGATLAINIVLKDRD
jgi:ubiquinone biosynthesis protein